jgi:hypothetical protein
VAVWLVVHGAAAAVWRVWRDKPWLDALVFAGILAVGNAVGQWLASRARRKATGRGD